MISKKTLTEPITGSESYALLRAKSLAKEDDLFEGAENLSAAIVVIAKATLRHDPNERIQTFADLRDLIDGVIKAPKQSNIDRGAILERIEAASLTADPLPKLDVPVAILPAAVTLKTTQRAEGELIIPTELLGVGQVGAALTLQRIEPDPNEKLIVRVGTSLRIGRVGTADLVTRFLPRNTANDTKTKRLSKIHVTCKCKGDQILLADGDGGKPSANGSTFDSIPLSPKRPTALVKPGELRLANAFSIQVIPRITNNDDAPIIANVGDWRGSTTERKARVGGAILFMPSDSIATEISLWLFSLAEFGHSTSHLNFVIPAEEPKIGALRYYRGCFWIENKSADILAVDGLTLASADIAPLATGQILEVNNRTYSVEIEKAAMPSGAIFMSYAREDEEAARTLKAGLERHGCIVWYDRERLKPGGNWHNNLEDEVKGRCSLFLSIISHTTERSPAGYFHRERNWAAEWQAMFSEGEEFYVPVVIDDSALPAKREPRSFRNVHATQLLKGEVTREFGEHLRELLEKRRTDSPL